MTWRLFWRSAFDDWFQTQPRHDPCSHHYDTPIDVSGGVNRWRVWTCRCCGEQHVQDLRDGLCGMDGDA